MRKTAWIRALHLTLGAAVIGCAPADGVDLYTAGIEDDGARGSDHGLVELLCEWLDAEDACAEDGLAGTGGEGVVMGAYGPGDPDWSDDVGVFRGRAKAFGSRDKSELQGLWVNHPNADGGYLQGDSSGPLERLEGEIVGEFMPFDELTGSLQWTWVMHEAQEIRVVDGVYRSVPGTDTGHFVGVYSQAEDLVPTVHTLSIRNEIDGRSQMTVGTYHASYEHFSHAAPGRHHVFEDAQQGDEPERATTIQGYEWYPVWPEAGENRDCGCSSEALFTQPPDDVLVPWDDAEITLEVLDGRGDVTIIEEPSADNDYELTIEWDDDPFSGPDWYEVELTFITY